MQQLPAFGVVTEQAVLVAEIHTTEVVLCDGPVLCASAVVVPGEVSHQRMRRLGSLIYKKGAEDSC